MSRGHTEGPVPVQGHPVVAALVPQRVFKVFDKIAMPRQEETSGMDLVLEGLDLYSYGLPSARDQSIESLNGSDRGNRTVNESRRNRRATEENT